MTRKQRRLTLIAVAGTTLAVAVALILVALEDQVVFFRTPSDLAAAAATGERVRLGGLVEAGSVQKSAGAEVTFAVTDTAAVVRVRYGGILPDLFREGQGVVTEGVMSPDGWLIADTVLARHDENYMPGEVIEALKQQGMWKDGRMVEAGAD